MEDSTKKAIAKGIYEDQRMIACAKQNMSESNDMIKELLDRIDTHKDIIRKSCELILNLGAGIVEMKAMLKEEPKITCASDA